VNQIIATNYVIKNVAGLNAREQ